MPKLRAPQERYRGFGQQGETTMRTRIAIAMTFCALLLALAAGGANAGTKWICSIMDAVECADDGYIGEPDFFGLERPTFMSVDVEKKTITLLAPESRRGEVTKIGTIAKEEDLWVFTGIEDGRAWSMLISSEGYMTLSITYDGVTWSAFGHAMADE
jgi:hypothetical protein